ncbi:hypothetical protein [Chitinivibrio alkaliphilus]|uniref:Lipoprotein n=1 Tax=Chitinivibrio alkaliphilus ACht1 TaxID=1313304 RepID=U7D9S6_9BACT|nr:hypothetical protein [Chitinivibrio alkaliphilus]ERP38767.1 hypothetical protein CALK_0786 [Chitinivibrio alkaliphilus ACht1]
MKYYAIILSVFFFLVACADQGSESERAEKRAPEQADTVAREPSRDSLEAARMRAVTRQDSLRRASDSVNQYYSPFQTFHTHLGADVDPAKQAHQDRDEIINRRRRDAETRDRNRASYRSMMRQRREFEESQGLR